MRACVAVDPSTTSKGVIGFVSAVHTEERKIDVNYIENSIGIINSSQFINEERLHAQSFYLSGGGGGGGTARSGCRCAIEFGEAAATVEVTPPPSTTIRLQKRKKKRIRPMNMYDIVAASRSWLPSAGPHPLLKKLREGKENNEAGWLRKEVKTVLKLLAT
jgi:hypothetical protein